jgi:hypothetical protein
MSKGKLHIKGGGGYVLSSKAFHLLGKKLSVNLSFCRESGAEVNAYHLFIS